MTVHVKVSDVNEYAPVFVEPSYVRDVDEGRLYEEVVALQADDQDCSPKYGDICRYELLTRDQVGCVGRLSKGDEWEKDFGQVRLGQDRSLGRLQEVWVGCRTR